MPPFWETSFLHLGALHGRFWRGPGRSGEGFGSSNGLFFQVFSCFRMHARWRCAKIPDVKKPQFFMGFSQANRTCCAQDQKQHNIAPKACRTELSTKIVLQTRLGACQALLGRGLREFWTPLGRLLAGFWLLLDGFWTLLGVSSPPLGRFRAPLGSSQAPFGCILAHQDAPGLDFGGFRSMPGWVLEGLAGMFWHALRCASHFIT